jgi:hypothetical protein
MKKRTVAAALWFASLASLGGFAEAFFGLPSDIGSFLGIAAAAVVLLDPSGHAWGGRRRSRAQLVTNAGPS